MESTCGAQSELSALKGELCDTVLLHCRDGIKHLHVEVCIWHTIDCAFCIRSDEVWKYEI
eukprot:151928-Ditylum_brightwellii.AAC.1